jgi:hypothetical protein
MIFCFVFLFLAQIENSIARRNQEQPPRGIQRKHKNTLRNNAHPGPNYSSDN